MNLLICGWIGKSSTGWGKVGYVHLCWVADVILYGR